MSQVSDLQARIDGAFTAAREKVKQQQQQFLQEHIERQRLMKEYEKVQAKIVEIGKPRLEALAKRAGDRVAISPSLVGCRRSVGIDFKSPKAHITLTFSAAPDRDIRNAVVECDLRIIPLLWKFEAHSEFSSPIAAFDAEGLAKWFDDRIVGFVEILIQIHEGALFDQADYVEDPVAGVKFPKFAAGATLDHGGKSLFFVDDATRAEYARRNGLATA